MNFIKTSTSMCLINIRKWAVNPRIYVIAILVIIMLFDKCRDITNYAYSIGYNVTPWIMPFIFSYQYTRLVLLFGIVLLFCDAPFISIEQPYLIIRSKKNRWAAAQIFYIIISSAIYFLFVMCVSIVLLLPNLYFSSHWGKVINTMVYNSNIITGGMIVNIYTPFWAMFNTFVLNWLLGIVLGLIIFVLNMLFSRSIGAIAAAFIILLNLMVYGIGLWVSPVTLGKLAVLDTTGMTDNPSLTYAYCFFIVSIILLGIVSLKVAKNNEINTMPNI